MHRLTTAVISLLLAVTLAACGGTGTADPGTDGGGTDGGTDTTEPTPPPAGQTPAPGGAVEVPTIAEALYMSGSAHLEVTGDASMQADVQLVGGASLTTAENFTSLMYLTGDGAEAISLQLILDPEQGAAISLTSSAAILAGGVEQSCRIQVDRNDPSGIGGTFSCADMPGFRNGGLDEVLGSISGTFTADR